jgi:F-type H+-transporting ATPase subunit b
VGQNFHIILTPVVAATAEPTNAQVEPTNAEVSPVAETGGVAEAIDAEAEATVEAQPDNPILPVGSEMIWGGASFLVLWALMKFVLLKPLLKVMAERNEKVRADLEAAEKGKEQAESSVVEYEASLASARAESGRLIDDGRAQAEDRRREVLAAAEATAAEQRAAAAAEVAGAKARALDEMRPEITTLAVQAAQAVLGRQLDAGAQRPTVDAYLDRVGSRN